MNIWHSLVLEPLINGLLFLYELTGNLGVSVIMLSAVINVLLFPLEFPNLREQRRRQATMRQLAPRLREVSQVAQKLELLKQHKMDRPLTLAGCLPVAVVAVIRLSAVIALIQVFWHLPSGPDLIPHLNESLWSPLKLSADASFSTRFTYLDLRAPDVLKPGWFPVPLPGLFLLAAAVLTFISDYWAKAIKERQRRAILPTLSADERKLLASQGRFTRRVGLYFSPMLTTVIGFIFPSAFVLYWLPGSVVGLIRSRLFQIAED